jgi:hypothetical protein
MGPASPTRAALLRLRLLLGLRLPLLLLLLSAAMPAVIGQRRRRRADGNQKRAKAERRPWDQFTHRST